MVQLRLALDEDEDAGMRGQAERPQCAFQRVGVLVARGEAIVERRVPGRAGDVRQRFHVAERGQVLVRTQQHLGRDPLPHAVQRHALQLRPARMAGIAQERKPLGQGVTARGLHQQILRLSPETVGRETGQVQQVEHVAVNAVAPEEVLGDSRRKGGAAEDTWEVDRG
ncbi:hypothetical protein ACWEPN_02985 [Nonomuraea wenchangensis]